MKVNNHNCEEIIVNKHLGVFSKNECCSVNESKGRSFEFSLWKPLTKYSNTEYKQDFVSYDNVFLACKKTHTSGETLSFVFDENNNVIDVKDGNWYVVLSSRASNSGEQIVLDDSLNAESTNGVQNKVITKALDDKVDKIEGKQLSTEDFTTVLREKLDGLKPYDDTDIVESINNLRSQLDSIINGNSTTAIETFNEVIAFLKNIEDTSNLEGIIGAIQLEISDKQDIIEDLDEIRNNATSSLKSIPENYITEESLNDKSYITINDLPSKQDPLVSGVNIKTINGESIVGPGNIEVSPNITIDEKISEFSENPVQNKVVYGEIKNAEEVYAASVNDLNSRLELSEKEIITTTNNVTVLTENINDNLYTKDEWVSSGLDANKANGVAIITPDARFVIAKEMVLNKELSNNGIGELTIIDSSTKRTDYDGKKYTNILLELESPAAVSCNNYKFPNGKNGYLPAIGEWHLARQYGPTVTELMLIINGASLTHTTKWWSSSISSITAAWQFKWDDNASDTQVLDYKNYVRPFCKLD